MEAREYRRRARQLCSPLIAAITFGALAAAVWAAGVSLILIWDVDADILSPVLGAVIAVLALLLIIWFLSALRGDGGCN